MVTGPVVVLTVVGQWPLRLPGPEAIAVDVALPAQELGDLGLDGGLHQQAHAEARHLLQHDAAVTVRAEQFVDLGADELDGGHSRGHGCGFLLCL
jgi:hypothetical protein